MFSFVCYVCETPHPVEYRNKHHKVPKSLGGEDSDINLVDLCAGCHQFLHAVARMMRSPKRAGDVRSVVQGHYPAARSQSRCLELAKLECRSEVLNRAQVSEDVEREIGIRINLKTPYRNALQLIARDRGLSMSDYVRKFMEDHIRKVYPNVEKV